MTQRLTRRTALALFGGGAATLVGYSDAKSANSPTTAVMLCEPEPPNLAAYLHSAFPTAMVATKVYDGLLEYDENLKPQPCLAESWETGSNGLALTFKLRRNARWHDGKPFTSEDVKFSILNVFKPYHSRGMVTFKDVSDVETPDPYTAVFRLARPAPYIMMALSRYETPMMAKHLLEGVKIDSTAKLANQPVGTGPFRFVEWRRGQYIRLDRNKEYWADQPGLQRLVIRFIPDAETRTAAMEKGEVHLAGLNAIPNSDIARLAKLPSIKTTERGYTTINPICQAVFNTRRPIFSDQRVRQALSYAVNRQYVIDNIFFGYGKKAVGPIHSNLAPTGIFTTDVKSYDVADSVQRAKKLLDEAGYPEKAGGIRFEMVLDPTPYGEEWRRLAEYVQSAFGAIGVKATVRWEDVPTWLRRIYTDNDFDLTPGWIANLTDPVLGVFREYHSSYIRKGAVFTNASGWSTPETDDLMNRASVELDSQRRAALYHEFARKVVEAAPTIYFVDMDLVTVYDSRLRNVNASGLGIFGGLDKLRFS